MSRERDRERERDRHRDRDYRREREDDNQIERGRALFVGNLDPLAKIEEVERLFMDKGRVEKIDLKQGYAFVFLESGHNEAIKDLDGTMHLGRRLKVELARGDGLIKRREDERRRIAQSKPCETLFVVNFDPYTTHSRDLDRLFARYGRVIRVEMKKNFAFIQFSSVDEAAAALQALNNSVFQERNLTVEYVARPQDDGGGRTSRKRYRSPSPPRRRGSPSPRRARRSPSPPRRRDIDDRRDRRPPDDRRYDDRDRDDRRYDDRRYDDRRYDDRRYDDRRDARREPDRRY